MSELGSQGFLSLDVIDPASRVSDGSAIAASDERPVLTFKATSSNASQPSLSKDEIGWYFVEQYYSTLTRSPEKLHVGFTCVFKAMRSSFNII